MPKLRFSRAINTGRGCSLPVPKRLRRWDYKTESETTFKSKTVALKCEDFSSYFLPCVGPLLRDRHPQARANEPTGGQCANPFIYVTFLDVNLELRLSHSGDS